MGRIDPSGWSGAQESSCAEAEEAMLAASKMPAISVNQLAGVEVIVEFKSLVRLIDCDLSGFGAEP